MTNEQHYNEFVKHHIPIFKAMRRKKSSYRFCNHILCADCGIQDSCSINKYEIIVPSISKKQYKEVIKEHPEYRI